MRDFIQLLENEYVILDGATGSNLQNAGMPSGVCPESWILEHEEVLLQLQKDYIEAGSQVLYAPTFTCNSIKLKEYGKEDSQEDMIHRLVAISKRAIQETKTERDIYIAGDLTMTGEQLYPIGDLTFEELVNVYKEQVRFCVDAGVDLFVVETMMSLQETRAAILAVKESCDLPVMATLTYNEDMRTFYGTNPETAMIVLQGMGACAVGINCSTGPVAMVPAVKEMMKVAKVPVIVKPNAGLPQRINGKSQYELGPEEFAKDMEPILEAGASVIGGCCGTTPEHIKALADLVLERKKKPLEKKEVRALTTERNVLHIGLDNRFMMVGERINPTGKKDLQEELRQGKLDLVTTMAEQQITSGAKVLDVNMGMNGIDEKEKMVEVIYHLTGHMDVPLSIDSSYTQVVEAALRIYPGRALINSISLEEAKIKELLPVARKYGAMFILLPLSEKGLPKNLQEKKHIIHEIMEKAKEIGLDKEDIMVDGLVTTVGANPVAAKEVLETISYCHDELGLATICGLSNISFGLPERPFINSAFLTLAIEAGLTMAIANPNQDLLVNAALGADLLLNKPEGDLAYIEGVRSLDMKNKQVISSKESENAEGDSIKTAVIKGRKDSILSLVEEELKKRTPEDIIETSLISGINQVGTLFENKKYYLPQLIASATTMECAMNRLEPLLAARSQGEQKETIIMATVKGDIHDIGKNLVCLMLKNHGYQVIDLGKDVECDTIVQRAKEEDAKVIGLSALMTTTMMEMKKVVDQVRAQGMDTKIIIGGAVVTDSFATEIGADGYSKDAQEAVILVNRLLGRSK